MLAEQLVERDLEVGGRARRRAEALLLRDRGREQVAGHEHVLVRTVRERVRLRVVALRERVELALELQDVRGQVVHQRLLRQPRRLREERSLRLDVRHQVRDGLLLAGGVLLRERDRVVDEVLDVRPPEVLAVEELLARGGAVDRRDRLRERDRVRIELLRDGVEVRAADIPALRRLDGEDRVLAEELVERDAELHRLRRGCAADVPCDICMPAIEPWPSCCGTLCFELLVSAPEAAAATARARIESSTSDVFRFFIVPPGFG